MGMVEEGPVQIVVAEEGHVERTVAGEPLVRRTEETDLAAVVA